MGIIRWSDQGVEVAPKKQEVKVEPEKQEVKTAPKQREIRERQVISRTKPKQQEVKVISKQGGLCFYCEGKGWTDFGKCDICRGSGRIPKR